MNFIRVKLVLLLSKSAYQQQYTVTIRPLRTFPAQIQFSIRFFSLPLSPICIYAYVEVRRQLVPKRQNSCYVSAGSNKIFMLIQNQNRVNRTPYARLNRHTHRCFGLLHTEIGALTIILLTIIGIDAIIVVCRK